MQMGMLLGREITADDVEPLTWALAEIGRERSAADYLARRRHPPRRSPADRRLVQSAATTCCSPRRWPRRRRRSGSFDDSGDDPMDAFHRAFTAGAFTALFNVTGQPAISLPLHWTEEGVPVGVQLVAPFGREDLLIRVAAQLERAAALGGADARPCSPGEASIAPESA